MAQARMTIPRPLNPAMNAECLYTISFSPATSFADIWAITELAENVLAKLPMKDLLLAQRVSKDWKALIDGSPRLQELLFMRPRRVGTDEVIHYESNPLLAEKMPLWFPEHIDEYLQDIKSLPWASTVSRLAFLRKDASWRRMLVSQPALRVFEHVRQVYARGGNSLRVGCIEQPDGVRMGMAYDMAAGNGDKLLDRLPTFYTLIGGRLAKWRRYSRPDHIAETLDSNAESPSHMAAERIFGGSDRFTLLSKHMRHCKGVDKSQANDCRQYISGGRMQVEIELSAVDRPSTQDPYGTWWSRTGYRKKDPFD